MIDHAQYIREGYCPHVHSTPHGEVWCYERRGHGGPHNALSLAPKARAYRVEWEE